MTNDREKTGWILAAVSVLMSSPLVMVFLGYNIPVFQNLGFGPDSFAPSSFCHGIVFTSFTTSTASRTHRFISSRNLSPGTPERVLLPFSSHSSNLVT